MTYTTKQMTDYMRVYRLAIKERIITLLGGKCVECGSGINLQVHHPDPKTKKFTIAKNWTRKFEKNLEEINKCVLLCKDCHIDEHKQYEHGVTLYRQGCRCQICRGAQAIYRHMYYSLKGK